MQFSRGSWLAVGGAQYASLPHLASKAQQIKAAERLWVLQGWKAWPVCSRKVGLR